MPPPGSWPTGYGPRATICSKVKFSIRGSQSVDKVKRLSQFRTAIVPHRQRWWTISRAGLSPSLSLLPFRYLEAEVSHILRIEVR